MFKNELILFFTFVVLIVLCLLFFAILYIDFVILTFGGFSLAYAVYAILLGNPLAFFVFVLIISGSLRVAGIFNDIAFELLQRLVDYVKERCDC